jgi:Rps23 Pro-64 3,4-dihydroxylase Tpa1-like proline 4-hydroxylase
MNNSELKILVDDLSKKIITAKDEGTYFFEPFQHLVIDNFLPLSVAHELLRAFPDTSDDCWQRSNDEGIEIKARTDWQSEFDIPDRLSGVVRILNSAPILRAMSEVLSIPKLMSDPYYSGGGLNVSERGGLLDVHVDGNYHDASGMNRRVNLLYYLNPNWEPAWGGEFGIYDNTGEKLAKAVSPIFNRCIIFDTHDKSYHGLPNPINFPTNDPRRSILLYYYTVAKRPNAQITEDQPHSALWKSKGFTDKRGNKTRDYT